MVISVFFKRCGYVFLVASALTMSACSNKAVNGGVAGGTDSVVVDSAATAIIKDIGADSLKTDTVSYDKEEGIYKLGLWVKYPVAGGDSVVKAVREFINDYLGGAYEGPLDDGRKMLKENGEMMWGRFQEMCGDADPEEVNELFLNKMVNKDYETSLFVTFMAFTSHYTGGLHGMAVETGHTFSKLNGKCFCYDMMKDLDSPAFKRLIKEGLKTFFSNEGDEQGMSDEDLKEELVSFGGSIDELPLPDSEPYMTKNGVTFIYQPYEISYYAAGRPEFTIPYDVVIPYLKPQTIELFLGEKAAKR